MPKGLYKTPERLCIDCGKCYLPTSNVQKRCPDCREAINKIHHANWMSRNVERNLTTSRRSYQKNREVAMARVRKWIEANRDKYNDYSNDAHYRRRGRYKERVVRSDIFARDKGICGICGTECDPDDYHLDHIVPLSRGGWHYPDNVQVAHPQCNRWKHNMLQEEYDAVARKL